MQYKQKLMGGGAGRVGLGGQADGLGRARDVVAAAGGATAWLCGAGGRSVAMKIYWNDLWNSTWRDGVRIRRVRAGGMLCKLFLII